MNAAKTKRAIARIDDQLESLETMNKYGMVRGGTYSAMKSAWKRERKELTRDLKGDTKCQSSY